MKRIIATILIITIMLSGIGVYADTTTDIRNALAKITASVGELINAVMQKFSDLMKDGKPHWATELIGRLTEIGLIKGYPDGTFKPDQVIQVDEFIKLTVNALGYNLENAKPYWAENYINKALELGLVEKGEFYRKDNVNFYTKPLNRREMARIIARAEMVNNPNATQETFDELERKYSGQLRDYNEIEKSYKIDVLRAYSWGLITGKPKVYNWLYFEPKESATRAEATTVIVRLIDKSQRKIPTASKYDPRTPYYEKDEVFVKFIEKYPDNVTYNLRNTIKRPGMKDTDPALINYLYERKPTDDAFGHEYSVCIARKDYYVISGYDYMVYFLEANFNDNNKPAFKYALQLIVPKEYEKVYEAAIKQMGNSYGAKHIKIVAEGRNVIIARQTDGIFVLFCKNPEKKALSPYLN